MDFKEWFEEEKGRYVLRLDVVPIKKGFKACQQSKQAEIDELQKRINDALSEIESGITGKHHVKRIVKILKGEQE